MSAVETALRTAAGLVVLPTSIFLGSALALALTLIGVPSRRLHWIYVGCSRLCLWIGGTRVEILEARTLDVSRAYVVVPNHESTWDLPCITLGLAKLTLRFVAKHQVMRVPVFGQALRLTGNISVVRTDTTKDVDEIWKVMDRRQPGVSVVFFAEGTRSSDGAMHQFRAGAFATALSYGLPILPVGIAGTYAIWPKGAPALRRGPVVIKVGRPIETEGLTYEDREALRERTFECVARLRAEARAALRASGSDPRGID